MAYRHWDENDIRVRPSKRGSRPRTKDRPVYSHAEIGRVITVDRGRYTVILDEGAVSERTVITVRAKELRRFPVVVGDWVALVGDTSGSAGSLARLVRIEERSTLLRRSADDTDPHERIVVANATQLIIVVAAAHPQPRTGFIDRSLIAAFDAGMTPVLCITKTDLRYPQEILDYYANTSFQILLSKSSDGLSPDVLGASGLDQELLERLLALLDGQVSVLLGHSGVGKSTLVNALTGSDRDTGHVNAVTGRGRHTSSSAVALRPHYCGAGSWIIDTPGIRSFGLAHVDSETIVAAFTDLLPGAVYCPRGCTHCVEVAEQCGIAAYVDSGEAGKSGRARLESLRKLLGANSVAEQGFNKELGIVE